ncbi:MAG TPA: hypothetical protein VLF91_04510 [Candidatus Saccharimonadales bacterium]|nr:hypothetical protein [Candidatus Saccharimonadales bacterium]
MAQANNDPAFTDDEYEIKLLLQKPRFQSGVLAIRKKWKIPATGFPDNITNNAWQDKVTANLPEYREDIWQLMRELELAERWHQGISYYIQNNLPGMLRIQPANSIRFTYEGEPLERRNVRSVSIEVDASTTQRELLERFEEAQEILGVEKKKKQQPKNLDRDLDILKMHNDGMKNAAIAKWLSSNTDNVFNEDDVKTIIKRIKHRLN